MKEKYPWKLIRRIGMPSYILVDMLSIAVVISIDILYRNHAEAWYSSYLYIYLLFCASVFLKQYDREYMEGIRTGKDGEIFDWIVLFAASLFPGWLAGGAAFGTLGFSLEEVGNYDIAAIPFALIYPLLFGLFPFRNAREPYISRLKPVDDRRKMWLVTLPGIIIFLMSSYLLIFCVDVISQAFPRERIASMDLMERIALWWVSMMALIIIYLPARIHFFFRETRFWKNMISLAITAGALSVYALTGLDLL